MSAWVLLLVFWFADGGSATSVVIDMANYQACSTAQEQVRRASEFDRDNRQSLKFAVCLEC
ncbi:MAG: hypothetical protein RJA36_2424 [Pseudomonadota bacterium]